MQVAVVARDRRLDVREVPASAPEDIGTVMEPGALNGNSVGHGSEELLRREALDLEDDAAELRVQEML
jgi:hypothetical protein